MAGMTTGVHGKGMGTVTTANAKQRAKPEVGEAKHELSKFAPSALLPLAQSDFLKLSLKQHHPLATKCSNPVGNIFPLNHQTLRYRE